MRSIRQLLSLVLGTFVLAGALLGFSAPALAHDAAESSSPAQGATLATPPEQVSVTFNKNPLGIGAQFSGKDAAGAEWADGAVEIVENVASQKLKPGAPAAGASPSDAASAAAVPTAGTPQPGTTATPLPAVDASEPFPWSLVIFVAVAVGLLVTIALTAKRRLTTGDDTTGSEDDAEQP